MKLQIILLSILDNWYPALGNWALEKAGLFPAFKNLLGKTFNFALKDLLIKEFNEYAECFPGGDKRKTRILLLKNLLTTAKNPKTIYKDPTGKKKRIIKIISMVKY